MNDREIKDLVWPEGKQGRFPRVDAPVDVCEAGDDNGVKHGQGLVVERRMDNARKWPRNAAATPGSTARS